MVMIIYRGRSVECEGVVDEGIENSEVATPHLPLPTPFLSLRLTLLVLLGVTGVVGVTAQSTQGIGNTTQGIGNSQVGNSSTPYSLLPTPSSTSQPRRLKINLNITNPDELRVSEGQQVRAGQVLADRPQERARLDRERRQTLLAIANIERQSTLTLKPATSLRELPPVSFAIEESRIQQAELEFSQAQRNLQNALENDPFITARAKVDKAKSAVESAYRAFELQQRKLDAVNGLKGLPPEMLEHETEKLRQRQSEVNSAQAEYDFYSAEYRQVEEARNATVADLQNKVQLARAQLEISQAQLRTAKELRERAEYDHRITLARRAEEENQAAIAASNQRLDREFKLAQLREQLSSTEEKLNGIVQVKSPYGGTIQRVKTDKQTDGRLSVTVYLLPNVVISR